MLIGGGGYHIGVAWDEPESIRIVRTALDNGAHFLGNCRDHNGGVSVERVAKPCAVVTSRAFVMTKLTDKQTKERRNSWMKRFASYKPIT